MRTFISGLRQPTATQMEDYLRNLDKEEERLLKIKDELRKKSEEILRESKELEAFETQLQEKFELIQQQLEVIRHNLNDKSQQNDTTANKETPNIIHQFLVKPRSLWSLFRKRFSFNF